MTAPVPANTVDVDTDAHTGDPDVVESSRSNASTLTPASTRAIESVTSER